VYSMLNKLIKDDCIRTKKFRQDRKNKLKEIKKKLCVYSMLNKLIKDDCIRTKKFRQDRKNKLKEIIINLL